MSGVRHGLETTWFLGVLQSTQEYADGKPHGQGVTLQTILYIAQADGTVKQYESGIGWI